MSNSTLKQQILKNQARNMLFNKFWKGVLWVVTISTMLFVFSLLMMIIGKGVTKIDFGFLVNLPDEIEAGGGIGPLLFNSFYVLLISLAFSLPFGIGAGIYLAEYAPKNKMTEFISTCVESLASVPSIVMGLFGYVLFVEYFGIGVTILGAGISLAFLNLPVITRITEESINAVPRQLREAALSLGATKFQCIWKVVLPAALGGIMTGVSLATCRAFGESAVILIVGGTGTSGEMWDFSLFSPGATLPVHLWYLQSVSIVEDAKEIADKSAAILVLVVLMISVLFRIPVILRDRQMKK